MSGIRKSILKPALAAAVLAGTAVAGAAGGRALSADKDTAPEAAGLVTPSSAVARAGSHASLADMVEAVGPSVVQIQADSEPRVQRMSNPGGIESQLEQLFGYGSHQGRAPAQSALGSGFIIDKSGIILTNNHVIQDAERVKVRLSDGRELQGRVLGRDPKIDVAVVKVDGRGPFKPVRWGDSSTVRVGDSVFAVGSPFGLGNTVTSGIVSAQGRHIGAGPYDDFLQVDAAINSGNSGGPLFDAQGRVIGINTAIFSPTGGNVGIGFAIPASMAQKVAKDIVETGSVSRGRIGVALQDVSQEIASQLGPSSAKGALISDVEADGPAERAGMRPGDVVRSFAAKPIDDGGDLARSVADAKAGARVPITILRDGRRISLSITIAGETQPSPQQAEPGDMELRPSFGFPRG